MNPYDPPLADLKAGDLDYSLFKRMVKAFLWLVGFFLLLDIALWIRFREAIQYSGANLPLDKMIEWFTLR